MLTFYGVLIGAWIVALAGLVLSAATLAGWMWPRGETQET
jgi:hypothetical protein